jgi:hypothetical protein
VHQVEDWAEVHRLFHRERLSKAAIARRLGMSRNTDDDQGISPDLITESPQVIAWTGTGGS